MVLFPESILTHILEFCDTRVQTRHERRMIPVFKELKSWFINKYLRTQFLHKRVITKILYNEDYELFLNFSEIINNYELLSNDIDWDVYLEMRRDCLLTYTMLFYYSKLPRHNIHDTDYYKKNHKCNNRFLELKRVYRQKTRMYEKQYMIKGYCTLIYDEDLVNRKRDHKLHRSLNKKRGKYRTRSNTRHNNFRHNFKHKKN